MSGILISFHTPSNAGYAMAPLEKTFFEVAEALFGSSEKIHFAFQNLDKGNPESLPDGFTNVIPLDRTNLSKDELNAVSRYVKKHRITTAFCFDLQPHSPLCKVLREAGVAVLISYWGSTISGYNSGLKLLLKKLEVGLIRSKPDLFIFESKSMQSYAIQGRGILEKNTVVIPTGIDESKFSISQQSDTYLLKEFGIPPGAHVAFYSGHMEERKGVAVIMDAAIELTEKRGISDLYFLICGNRAGEEEKFKKQIQGTKAENRVIFAGYRNDLNKIMPSCTLGLIASTGWDSFPMSSIEMAASGLPLVVSNLQGLVETIVDKKTGLLFEPGDYIDMADKIEMLLGDDALRQSYSKNGIQRVHEGYTKATQKRALLSTLTPLFKGHV